MSNCQRQRGHFSRIAKKTKGQDEMNGFASSPVKLAEYLNDESDNRQRFLRQRGGQREDRQTKLLALMTRITRLH